MRLRELETLFYASGWQREPNPGGATVVWTHPSGKRFVYHKPHGNDACELPKSMVRQVLRRLERLEGQAR